MSNPFPSNSNSSNDSSPAPPIPAQSVTPIAIIGLSCRYPGSVTSASKLWDLLASQRDVWSPVPQDRFNHDAYYHPDSGRNGTSNARGAHFLNEHPAYFDGPFFGLTSAEAAAMDPQQRIMLECSYEALENAGIPIDQITGTNTSVFMGCSCRDYTDLLQSDLDKTELYQATGTGATMLANRISYFYDLKGPSTTVDTACSSSLVALHLACTSLLTSESRTAIVGGSNLLLSPSALISLSILNLLSPDGRCHTFDSRGNGFGRGEGVGCIVLKPLSEALKDGDTIRAVIRNTGTNQDGKTAGITLPSGEAQVQLMRGLYKGAGLDPRETTYVEAHGTGTAAGDLIEAESLAKVFSRRREEVLRVGSVKSNIGHLEGGSGMAGLIKTVLMLEGGEVLPNFDFREANPNIPLEKWKIEVPTTVQKWETPGIRRASVNNFGFGGSNAHVIVEDASRYLRDHSQSDSRSTDGAQNMKSSMKTISRARLFPLSAFDAEAGKRIADTLATHLANAKNMISDNELGDLAFTLGERRSHLSWHAAVHASSRSGLIQALSAERTHFGKVPKSAVIGFVFTGQGAQWPSMGRELIDAYPVFKDSLVRAEEYLKKLGAEWRLIDELLLDPAKSRIGTAIISQPLCTALQIALVDLLASWNIKPASVTGHSSGEIAAVYATGALTQESAMAISYFRGIACARVKNVNGLAPGAMLAVGLNAQETQPLISELRSGRANVACVNSPSSVTVSGDVDAVEEIKDLLEAKGVFARTLVVDTAYHSHHMEYVAESYLDAISDIHATATADIEFYSSVTGSHETSKIGPQYWVSNLVSPVQFSAALENLCLGTHIDRKKRQGVIANVDILIEIGPHSALSGPIKDILKASPALASSSVTYFSTLSRNKDAVDTALTLASNLFKHGIQLDMQAINNPHADQDRRVLINLPPYPWNHTTAYWAKSLSKPGHTTQESPRSDILGIPIKPFNPSELKWRNIMRTTDIPWIQDHNIQSNTVCPAAYFLVMAIEASAQLATRRGTGVTGFKLREITIGHALVISPDEEVETVLSLRPYSESTRISSDIWDEVHISSCTDGTTWTEHCRGLISVTKLTEVNKVDGDRNAQEEAQVYTDMKASFTASCTITSQKADIYLALSKLGLNFGPTFSNLIDAQASHDRCVAHISVPDTAATMPSTFEYPYILHPATLDSFFHAIFPVGDRHKDLEQGTPVPTFIEEMFVDSTMSKKPGHQFIVYAQVKGKDLGNSDSKGWTLTSNTLSVFDAQGTMSMPVATVAGLKFTALARPEDPTDAVEKGVHQIKWQPSPEFLSGGQVVEMTAQFRRNPKIMHQSRMVQQAAFYYAEQALAQVSESDVPDEVAHLRKLHLVLQQFCDAVLIGNLGVYNTTSWPLLSDTHRSQLLEVVSQSPYSILNHIGTHLPSILRGETEPLSLMIGEDRLEQHYRNNELLSQCYSQAALYTRLLANRNSFLNILEIGAGTGGATFPILEALSADPKTPHFANYEFTDISSGFFEKVEEKVKGLEALEGLIRFRRLDIEVDPVEQGFEAGSYDLIIASNVLHATKSIKETLERVRRLLKPGASLIMIEITVANLAASLIFGTLPGWWAGEEDTRDMGPLLTEGEWDAALKQTGFSGLDAALWDTPDEENHHSSTMISTAKAATTMEYPTTITIVSYDGKATPIIAEVQKLLSSLGVRPELSSLATFSARNEICIVVAELASPLLQDPSPETFTAIKSVFLESAGVLWVTRGANIESPSPASSLVTGIARAVRTEKGDTMLVNLDLDPNASGPNDDAEAILAIFKKNFYTGSILNPDLDVEYAHRDGQILIPRVCEDTTVTKFIASTTGTPVLEDQLFQQDGRYLRAEVKTPGFLDSLHFVDDSRMAGPLADTDVQIDVEAAGMNFRDVMAASGQIDPYPLGCECSGVVCAVGKQVENFQIGDHVITNVIGGCFCNAVRAPAVSVEKVPKEMPFQIAAALPIVYFTAYYAVKKVGRVQSGETVLIHAAAGGLGQAIINLCRRVGAEIYATVGTLEKKQLLIERFSIPESNIFSSRDATFAVGIMRRTNGKGVDVIMNSTSGEMLRQTWNCIAEFGRFVELGKRDMTVNTRLEMRHFERNVSFTGLDVPLHTRFEEKSRIWADIMGMFERDEIQAPWPVTTYGISEIETALRMMQTGKHRGKLVIVPREAERVKTFARTASDNLLSKEASYLLVGGLGGIGRAVAGWLMDWGAKSLIFMSPSGKEKRKAKDAIADLEARGAKVFVFQGDVSKLEDVKRMLQQSESTMPHIRGMIHAAMVPKADLLENLTLEDYKATISSKVRGTQHLHSLLSITHTDFFILLSSQVGTIGNASQAAYGAANVFLDSFAAMRNSQGLPAVSLALGRVVGVGFVAENQDAQRGLSKLWSRDIEPEELEALVKSAIVMPLRGKDEAALSIAGIKPWTPEASPIYLTPMFSHYRRAALASHVSSHHSGSAMVQVRELLKRTTSLSEATMLTCDAVMAKMSALLMIPVEDINADRSMSEYGMDSLVAVEMRNWLIRDLDAVVPILELLANVSLRQLAGRILRRSKLGVSFFEEAEIA